MANMKYSKKIFTGFITVVSFLALICGSAIPSAASLDDGMASEAGYKLIASSQNLKLYLNSENAFFYVENTLDGSIWHSNPTKEKDMYASGITMTELNSSILAVCHSTGVMDGSSVETLNSYSSSVLNDSFAVEKAKNGFKVIYTFDDDLLTVPLKVTLDDEALNVEVTASEIKMADNISVEKISVLPYFGCGTLSDKGYIFVPDGSGGIIEFNNGKSASGMFSKRIYGEDITDDDTSVDDIDDAFRATLPVFGLKRNNAAMLASIEKGAAQATVNAYTNGTLSENANVFADFLLYSNMKYSLSSSETTIFEKKHGNFSDIAVKYYFLTGEDADYTGMALKYKDVLIKNGVLTENRDIEPAPYISVYGGIVSKRSYFGFLIDTVIPMTTTDELLKIVKELREAGVENPVVNYKNWNEQELKGKSVTKSSISNKIEGKVKLSELYDNEQFKFYPMLSNTLSYTKQGLPFQKYFYRTTDISGVAIFKQKISKTVMQEYGDRIYYLNFKSADSLLSKLIKNVNKKKPKALALSDLGSMLYEDFTKQPIKRDGYEELFSDKLEKLSEGRSLLLDNPNLYALKYATEVINIPIMTDRQQIIDMEIPFVQTVLSGCVRYAANTLNYTDDTVALLKTLETGSMPHYFIYYGDESQLKASEYSELCFGNYKMIIPKLEKIYKAVYETCSVTNGSAISKHYKVADSVYATEYSNGATVYVNYGVESYSFNGLTVEGGSFFVKGANK